LTARQRRTTRDARRRGERAGGFQTTIAPTEGDYAESLETAIRDDDTLQIISFRLGGQRFALEVSEAVEVLKPRPLTDVPLTPEFVRGILSVRGEMVPVIDLGMRLGIGESGNGDSGRILIASVDDAKAGFTVDRLIGVRDIPARMLREAKTDGTGFVKSLFGAGANLLKVLDTARLIDFSVAGG